VLVWDAPVRVFHWLMVLPQWDNGAPISAVGGTPASVKKPVRDDD
jgi:hypothetical protein